ncbi:MAG: MFS transporter [Acetobacteraceae bacterium]|nr:MFS transporter [Acetobacteraceae bacterium]
MLKRWTASSNVLLLLCAMYFITYVDRVNVSSAAAAFKTDLGLSNTELGLVFSAFAYPYLACQIIGGWFGDRFGARRTLIVCGLTWAIATILTGLVGGLTSMLAVRVLLGLGEGATFPTATRAMSTWLPGGKSGWAQGITHAASRLGNTLTPPAVVLLMGWVSWRGSFIFMGLISLVWVLAWALYYRDNPRTHPGMRPEDVAALPPPRPKAGSVPTPWGPLLRRMAPVTFVYFCYGWTLWTFLTWVPQFMLHAYNLKLSNSALFSMLVFSGGVLGDALGGLISDGIYRRTGSLLRARRDLVIFGMLGSFACSAPVLFVTDPMIAAVALSGSLFFAELTIGPMWAIPMDIAPTFSGTASGLMNSGSALAAILSPLVFGVVIDATGNWSLPFYGTMGLMVVGVVAAFAMRPDRTFAASPTDARELKVA